MPFVRRSTSGLALPAPAALLADRSAPAAARRAPARARIPALPLAPATRGTAHPPAPPPARLPLRPHHLLLRAAVAAINSDSVGRRKRLPLEIGHIRVSAQPGDIVKPLGCRASPKPGAVSLRSHLRAPMPRSLRYSAWVYPASDEQRFGRAADSADPRSKGEWTFFSIRAGQIGDSALKPVSQDGSQHQQAVDSYLKLRETGDGLGVPDLALRDADQGLFIAMVALDLPAIHVGLQQRRAG